MSAADFDWGVSGDLLGRLRDLEAKLSRVRERAREWVEDDVAGWAGAGHSILHILDGAR